MFKFIWKHSKRDQILLLIVTVFLFPLLYLTLELPKQIINDAIGSAQSEIEVFGQSFSQLQYLMILCGFFLLAVLGHGLLKMRINTMKGVLAERLLRRFRYTLIARMLRFPQPYFEQTSQGELVSMVTAESEPMGGLMGDALAQPVLQAGQMLTILGFLFAQSIAFGLAACALIPLQAWLIPKLQREVNKLNRKRVLQVRALASEIGESAVGASTLRAHGGWRYRLAMISDRLGRLFEIRFEIYRKKFFMKFLNNFITQLTPFLFYAIGGYLVIRGDVTIGALVAALAAYKDLSSPWKELLAFYNQSADMSLRWETITERFAPAGMIDETLMYEQPDAVPDLSDDIVLQSVTVRDADGNSVLDRIDTTLPAGKLIGVIAPRDVDRRAFGELISREVMPSSGTVLIGTTPLRDLHQYSIATKIGHSSARPVLFQGSFGDNALMPVRFGPLSEGKEIEFLQESQRAGNSADALSAEWIDPARGHAENPEALMRVWCDLVEKIGGSDALLRRALDMPFAPDMGEELSSALIALRPKVAQALRDAGLDGHVFRLDPDTYCPAIPVVQNLLFATPYRPLAVDTLVDRPEYVELFKKLGLAEDLVGLAQAIMDGLRQIFGTGGTDHPLFQKTGLDPRLYESALSAIDEIKAGNPPTAVGEALLLSVASSITAEQVGPAFPERIQDLILTLRAQHGAELRERLSEMFEPVSDTTAIKTFSVLENLLFGKISQDAGPQGAEIHRIVAEFLRDVGLAQDVLKQVFDVPISLGGSNLPANFAEPLSVARAVIKRPDILVLEDPMASASDQARAGMLRALRDELPDATILCLTSAPLEGVDYDKELELQGGRLVGEDAYIGDSTQGGVGDDLNKKVVALEQTSFFAGLDRKQLRLLAFGARWYTAPAGQYVFYKNDAPDSGAFVLIEGEADLLLPQDGGPDTLIATVGPGALVGELGLIRKEPRALDMRAKSDLVALRLGVEEFLAVVENDAATSFKLLQVVAGYVST